MNRPFFENSSTWVKLALLVAISTAALVLVPLLIMGIFQWCFDFSAADLNAVNEIIEELTKISMNSGLSPDEAAKYGFDLLPQYLPNYQHMVYAKWFLILSNQLSLLIAGSIFLWIVYKKPLSVIASCPANVKMYALSAALLLLVMPLVGLIGEWNRNIYIPWQNLQNWLLAPEIQSGIYTLSFTDIHSTSELILMVIFIGVVTAIAEELVFRAALQNILLQSKMNAHLAIFIGATLFSLIHFQFYGFFVRLLLGLVLGYLYYWSKDIRSSILAHALNNSLAIVVAYKTGSMTDEIPDQNNLVLLISTALAAVVVWQITTIGKAEKN